MTPLFSHTPKLTKPASQTTQIVSVRNLNDKRTHQYSQDLFTGLSDPTFPLSKRSSFHSRCAKITSPLSHSELDLSLIESQFSGFKFDITSDFDLFMDKAEDELNRESLLLTEKKYAAKGILLHWSNLRVHVSDAAKIFNEIFKNPTSFQRLEKGLIRVEVPRHNDWTLDRKDYLLCAKKILSNLFSTHPNLSEVSTIRPGLELLSLILAIKAREEYDTRGVSCFIPSLQLFLDPRHATHENLLSHFNKMERHFLQLVNYNLKLIE